MIQARSGTTIAARPQLSQVEWEGRGDDLNVAFLAGSGVCLVTFTTELDLILSTSSAS